MLYPMKKRIWINGERLDKYEVSHDEVTEDGQATVLGDSGNEVIVRIFGDGFSISSYAGGIAIDPFNGDIVILKRDLTNVTDISVYDGTIVDINAYFVDIQYDQNTDNTLCTDSNVIKPAIAPPNNVDVVTVSLIKIPETIGALDGVLYPITWCTSPTKSLKSICDKHHNADILADDEILMYTQFNEYAAPTFMSRVSNNDTFGVIELTHKMDSFNAIMRTKSGICKGAVVLSEKDICKIFNEIPNETRCIISTEKAHCYNIKSDSKRHDDDYYSFMLKLTAVFPDNSIIVTPAHCVTMNSNINRVCTTEIDDATQRIIADIGYICGFKNLIASIICCEDNDPLYNSILKLKCELKLKDHFYLCIYNYLIDVQFDGDIMTIRKKN